MLINQILVPRYSLFKQTDWWYMTDIWPFCFDFRVLLSVCLILIQGSSYMNYGEVLIVLTFTGKFSQGNTFLGIFVLVGKIPPSKH